MPLVSSRKPQLFTKVIHILKQLTSTKGFTISRITNELSTHLKQMGVNRNNRKIKLLVEQALKYGVKNKMLLLKSGKFHITVSNRQINNRKRRKPIRHNKSKEKKLKSVRFKRGKTDIREALHQTSSKSSKKRARSRKASKGRKSKSRASKSRVRRRSRTQHKSRDKARPKKRLKKRRSQSSSSNSYTNENEDNQNNSNNTNKTNDQLVENKESKEPLNVSSEADTHEACRNKNRSRGNPPNIMEPPRLESDSEEQVRPSNKYDTKKPERYKSRVCKEIEQRYKCCHHRPDGRSRLTKLIPDEKSYRKFKSLFGKHRCDHKKCKEKLYFDEQRRLKHKHKCGKYCHCNSHEYLLEHEHPNILLNHKSKSKTKSKTSMQKQEEKLSPFEVFLQKKQEIIEDLEQIVDTDETIESQIDDEYGTSYIN